jgi:hypothetical protein
MIQIPPKSIVAGQRILNQVIKFKSILDCTGLNCALFLSEDLVTDDGGNMGAGENLEKVEGEDELRSVSKSMQSSVTSHRAAQRRFVDSWYELPSLVHNQWGQSLY